MWTIALLVRIWPELDGLSNKAIESLEIDAVYAVYLDRQSADIEQMKREENRAIPDALDYGSLPGLSNELKQKMLQRRPRTIAAAGRIEGMTPAAMAIIAARVREVERSAGEQAA